MIGALTTPDNLQNDYLALAQDLAHHGPAACKELPGDFATLTQRVEAVEGVHFAELATRLNAIRYDLDDFLRQLIETGVEGAVKLIQRRGDHLSLPLLRGM
ncbi:MAG: hypothetical protein WCK65_12470 [Rhodospirillaceae bacterium]